jgi:hypothetical protein
MRLSYASPPPAAAATRRTEEAASAFPLPAPSDPLGEAGARHQIGQFGNPQLHRRKLRQAEIARFRGPFDDGELAHQRVESGFGLIRMAEKASPCARGISGRRLRRA